MWVKIFDKDSPESYGDVGEVIFEGPKDFIIEVNPDKFWLVDKAVCYPVIFMAEGGSVITYKDLRPVQYTIGVS